MNLVLPSLNGKCFDLEENELGENVVTLGHM